MTSRGHFDKMNSTLGSVVPLAMFIFNLLHIRLLLGLWLRMLLSKLDMDYRARAGLGKNG